MINDIHIVKVGPHQQDTVMFPDGICRCICCGTHNNTNSYLKIYDRGRVRKMTSKEIGRLMGVTDDEIDSMLKVIAPGCLNTLFGNSIVVDVMSNIFYNLLIDRPEPKNEKLW